MKRTKNSKQATLYEYILNSFGNLESNAVTCDETQGTYRFNRHYKNKNSTFAYKCLSILNKKKVGMVLSEGSNRYVYLEHEGTSKLVELLTESIEIEKSDLNNKVTLLNSRIDYLSSIVDDLPEIVGGINE